MQTEFGSVVPEGRDRALMAPQSSTASARRKVPDDAVTIVAMLSQQALDIHARLSERCGILIGKIDGPASIRDFLADPRALSALRRFNPTRMNAVERQSGQPFL